MIGYGKRFAQNAEQRNLLTLEDLDKLPTHRLLTYFKKYRKLRYVGTCPCCGEKWPVSEEQDEYYNDCERYIQFIKELLDTREHIERKK